MKKISLSLLIIIMIVVISGCVRTRIIPYENIPRTPKPPGYQIEIYDSRDLNPNDYKIIGKIEAKALRHHNVNNTIEHLKERARQMGGDAILNLINWRSFTNRLWEEWKAEVIVWIKR